VASSFLTADTSVIVPSLLRWHALYQVAAAAVRDVRQVPAHALAESFSVLTRLPPPRALRPELASEALLHAFPQDPLILTASGYAATIARLADAGLGGGRVYDAVVGATAAEAGACLLTADRRALATYALVGAQVELLR
jgi:predicted nucleic acid-binding protein